MDDHQSKGAMAWLPSLLIVLFIIVLGTMGLLLALICIFAMPDQVVRPEHAVFVYFSTVLFLIGSMVVFGKKQYWGQGGQSEVPGAPPPLPAQSKIERTSSVVLRWIVLIYPIIYSFYGFVMGLICIYALPDQTVQPLPAALCFISGGLLMVGSLVAIVRADKS